MSSITSITPLNKQHKNVTSTSLTVTNSSNTNNKNTAIIKKIQPQAHSHNNKKQANPKKTEQKNPSTKKKISASAPTTPQQQRRTILPVKARRVQRRKEIVYMTEAIIRNDIESPSFTESDDSTCSLSSSLTSKKKKNKSKKTTSEVAVITTKPVMNNQPVVPKKSKNNDQQVRNRRRSSSVVEIRRNVYAGPTFNNAPAPSALPLPAFSPTLLSLELDDTLEKHSKDLMNILSPTKSSSTRIQYEHYRGFDKDLSEIQKGLRSMLKI